MTSSKKSAGIYLQDILDAIVRLETYAAVGEQEFFKNGLLQDGIIRQLSIIGEASGRSRRNCGQLSRRFRGQILSR